MSNFSNFKLLSLFLIIYIIFSKDVDKIKVVVGTMSRSEGTAYQAEKLIYHDDYTTATLKSDIGLVRVNKDIEFNDNVQPIKLPTKNTITDINESVITSGWGRFEVSNPTFCLTSIIQK